MPQSVKLLAFLLCMLTVVNLLAGLLHGRASTAPLRGPDGRWVVPNDKRHTTSPSRPDPVIWIVLGLPIAGAIVLLIDAFGRDYDGPRGLPLALAIMGLITLGT